MTAASRSLATALWRARFASGLLHHQMGHDPSGPAGVRLNEPKALRCIEPFHRARRHGALLTNGSMNLSEPLVIARPSHGRSAARVVVSSQRSQGSDNDHAGGAERSSPDAGAFVSAIVAYCFVALCLAGSSARRISR